MTLALDSSPQATTFSGASSVVAHLTTFAGNEVICVIVANESHGTPLATVASITSASGLAFARRGGATTTYGTTPCNLELWWAPAASALSGEAITVTLTGTIDDAVVTCFGVSGAYDYTHPWDTDASLPESSVATSGTPAAVGYATVSADTFVITWGMAQNPGAATCSGWTVIRADLNSGGALFCQSDGYYKVLSAPEPGTTSPFAFANGAIYLTDAISGDAPPVLGHNSSSKFLGYSVDAPTVANASKLLGYAAEGTPPASAAKMLGYAVEAPTFAGAAKLLGYAVLIPNDLRPWLFTVT